MRRFQIVRRAADQELQDVCEAGDTEPESPETPSHCLHQRGTCASASTCQAFLDTCQPLKTCPAAVLVHHTSASGLFLAANNSDDMVFPSLHPLEDVEHNCTRNVVGAAHPVLMPYLIVAHCAHQRSPLLWLCTAAGWFLDVYTLRVFVKSAVWHDTSRKQLV